MLHTDRKISEGIGEWTKNNRLIAHAGGGVERVTYTNSKEALEAAVRNGYQIVEVDFFETEDGKIVLGHEWGNILTDKKQMENPEKILTYNEYMEHRIDFRFTTMDVDGLIEFMRKNPDIYIVTDVKFEEDEKETLLSKVYSVIYKAAEEKTEILDRFIVQIYDEESCEIISSIYDFPEKIYTLYHYDAYNYQAAALLCLKYNIPVITTPESNLEPEMIEMLHSKGIKVYVHTKNSLIEVANWFDRGGDGVYTDWVIPEDLEILE